jgi:DNA-binding CsgD family transcriptional regulator
VHVKGTPWSPEEIEALEVARKSGKSNAQLAREHSVTHERIRQLIGNSNRPTRAERIEQVKHLHKQGLIDEEIRQELGFSNVEHVRSLRRAAGIKLTRARKPKATPEEVAGWANQGLSDEAIAARTGLSISWVRELRYRGGVKYKTGPKPRSGS